MMVPTPGTTLQIHSLGSAANLLGKPVTSVSLVGHEGKPLTWRQEADGLVIVCPPEMPFATAVAFNIR
jgi:alpha-L-fucosidase